MLSQNLRAIEIDLNTDERWDEFVKSVPGSLVYHHSAWLQVVEEAYGCTLINLACVDNDGRLWGILPLSFKRGIFTGRVFSSLFGTPVAGPLAHNYSALAVLMRAAVERTRSRPGIPLELMVSSNALDQVMPEFIGVPVLTTYVVHLPQRPELLRLGKSHNHASIKRAVNKATRLGVQVRLAETERELWDWYRLYLETMRRLTALPQSYQFFKTAWKRLHRQGLMQLLIAEHCQGLHSKLIGGLVLLTFGQTIYYAYGGWSWEDQSLRPNDALHWEAIQYACRKGFSRYDLGAGSMKQGLAEYKAKWGAQPEPIYSYRYFAANDLTGGISQSMSPTRTSPINIHAPASPIRQFSLSILRRLPARAVAVLSKWAHQI
jgi:serine/alanine adding enzyme